MEKENDDFILHLIRLLVFCSLTVAIIIPSQAKGNIDEKCRIVSTDDNVTYQDNASVPATLNSPNPLGESALKVPLQVDARKYDPSGMTSKLVDPFIALGNADVEKDGSTKISLAEALPPCHNAPKKPSPDTEDPSNIFFKGDDIADIR